MKPTILIADPEEAIRDSLQIVLLEEGYDSAVAASQPAMLELIRNQSYDLIIADVAMLATNVDEFTETVSSSSPSSKIIVTTSYEDVSYILALMRYGIMEYMIKPFEFDELIERIHKLLRQIPQTPS